MSDPTTPGSPSRSRRRRLSPLLLASGVAAFALLAIGVTDTLGGFTASITNNANTIATGTLLMSENLGATSGTQCVSSTGSSIGSNAGTCAINKFGGSTVAVPGGAPSTVTVTITNTGTVPANTFTLASAGCTATALAVSGGDTTGFCGLVDVSIFDSTTGKCVAPAATGPCTSTEPLTTLDLAGLSLSAPVAAGASQTFVFSTSISSTASNADQGVSASDNLTWSFAS